MLNEYNYYYSINELVSSFLRIYKLILRYRSTEEQNVWFYKQKKETVRFQKLKKKRKRDNINPVDVSCNVPILYFVVRRYLSIRFRSLNAFSVLILPFLSVISHAFIVDENQNRKNKKNLFFFKQL